MNITRGPIPGNNSAAPVATRGPIPGKAGIVKRPVHADLPEHLVGPMKLFRLPDPRAAGKMEENFVPDAVLHMYCVSPGLDFIPFNRDVNQFFEFGAVLDVF